MPLCSLSLHTTMLWLQNSRANRQTHNPQASQAGLARSSQSYRVKSSQVNRVGKPLDFIHSLTLSVIHPFILWFVRSFMYLLPERETLRDATRFTPLLSPGSLAAVPSCVIHKASYGLNVAFSTVHYYSLLHNEFAFALLLRSNHAGRSAGRSAILLSKYSSAPSHIAALATFKERALYPSSFNVSALSFRLLSQPCPVTT